MQEGENQFFNCLAITEPHDFSCSLCSFSVVSEAVARSRRLGMVSSVILHWNQPVGSLFIFPSMVTDNLVDV